MYMSLVRLKKKFDLRAYTIFEESRITLFYEFSFTNPYYI